MGICNAVMLLNILNTHAVFVCHGTERFVRSQGVPCPIVGGHNPARWPLRFHIGWLFAVFARLVLLFVRFGIQCGYGLDRYVYRTRHRHGFARL